LRIAGSAGSSTPAEPSTRPASSRVRDSRGDMVDLAQLTRDLESLRAEAVEAARTAASSEELAEREIDYLGKKGRLTTVLRGIGSLPAEDRPRVGSVANEVQAAIRDAVARAAEGLRGHALEPQQRVEPANATTPGPP